VPCFPPALHLAASASHEHRQQAFQQIAIDWLDSHGLAHQP
jgi:hypothetical protein